MAGISTVCRLYQQKRPDNMRLSSDSWVIIDARKYQNDIICLDVQRRDLPFTSPPSIYGNHPPICFTIAASGTLTCDSSTDQALSHHVISLWSVEMNMSQQQNESGNVSSIQYQILRVLSPSNQQLCLPSSLLRKEQWPLQRCWKQINLVTSLPQVVVTFMCANLLEPTLSAIKVFLLSAVFAQKIFIILMIPGLILFKKKAYFAAYAMYKIFIHSS